ncbi:hypothetical protein E2C01_008225 [Portunus trituberculatus]|uniref:Uncharacterized protein n=1 Tax=Portunus trituberculatus TaxID=210409 RepID=A0A5B7D593_PORTR|nr:hypothetical protein [Portunus trituberculatus]
MYVRVSLQFHQDYCSLEESWEAKLDTLFLPLSPVSSVDPSLSFISSRFREESMSRYLAIVSSSSPFSRSLLSMLLNCVGARVGVWGCRMSG